MSQRKRNGLNIMTVEGRCPPFTTVTSLVPPIPATCSDGIKFFLNVSMTYSFLRNFYPSLWRFSMNPAIHCYTWKSWLLFPKSSRFASGLRGKCAFPQSLQELHRFKSSGITAAPPKFNIAFLGVSNSSLNLRITVRAFSKHRSWALT